MSARVSVSALAALSLSACATVPTATPPKREPGVVITPPGPPARPAVRPGGASTPPAEVLSEAGLEGVIGANAQQLTGQFGQPALTVTEGDAIKLQWRGEACVLEAFLYPTTQGTMATTWVEARRASDGLDVQRGACVAAIRYEASQR